MATRQFAPQNIHPLATQDEAWQAIHGVWDWVLGIIARGYSLQFARRPCIFVCFPAECRSQGTDALPHP